MVLRMIEIESDGNVRVAAEGPITECAFHNDDFNPVEHLLGDGWSRRRVILDMSKADYVDSYAVGWLISCQKDFMKDRGLLVLHSVQPRVAKLFALLKIQSTIPIFENEQAARAAALRSAA
jgi:anti-anti-sigma factor